MYNSQLLAAPKFPFPSSEITRFSRASKSRLLLPPPPFHWVGERQCPISRGFRSWLRSGGRKICGHGDFPAKTEQTVSLFRVREAIFKELKCGKTGGVYLVLLLLHLCIKNTSLFAQKSDRRSILHFFCAGTWISPLSVAFPQKIGGNK